jgi:hypothetical protein
MSVKSNVMIFLSAVMVWMLVKETKLAQHNTSYTVADTPSTGCIRPQDAPHRLDVPYIPSSSEDYAMKHAEELGYNANSREEMTIPSCKILTDPTIPVYNSLQWYRDDLAVYASRVQGFERSHQDLRIALRQNPEDREAICSTVDLGLEKIFAQSQQLSHGSFGYAEPLIPPLRHPSFCFTRGYLINLSYLVHDWKVMCHRLAPHSRTVFIDMGASLVFHRNSGTSPAEYILETYKRFGFKFDHVYAYEVTPQEPAQVFQLVPEDLLPNYHWINVGVESDPNGKLNPLRMLLNEYNEDDFVVIKLDIDTGTCEPHLFGASIVNSIVEIRLTPCYLSIQLLGFIEVPLAKQLLEDDRYNKLVDQFYFEHHVFQQELTSSWGGSMEGSIKESLDLFRGLREKGIASHYWV